MNQSGAPSSSRPARGSGEFAQPPSRRYAAYVVALLAVGNLLSYLDRNIIFALFGPIKKELLVTDQQLGWLGSAYAIVFSLAALFSGVISDIVSRRAVLAGGLALWSGFTALGATARSYLQLFVTRSLVGVGQSAYLPAGQALLADYYPTKGRAQAMGIFWIGLALGGTLAVYIGGILGTFAGWRLTLIVVGLPGLIFALLMGRLRDPATESRTSMTRHPAAQFRFTRRAALRAAMPLVVSLLLATAVFGFLGLFGRIPPNAGIAAFGTVAGIGLIWSVYLWVRLVLRYKHLFPVANTADLLDEMMDGASTVLRTPTLIWLFVGGALTSAAMNSLVAWSTTYLQRELHMSLVEAGRSIGPIGLSAGIIGSWLGGKLGDEMMDKFPGGRVLAASLGFVIGAPLCFWMLLVGSRTLFGILFFFVVFFYTWYNGPVAAALFDVVPRRISATVMGVYVFFIHIAGDAIALPVIGALSDRFGIRPALLALPMIGLLGGVVLLFALFTVKNDMARVRRSPA
ncbi:MAG TPA: MFS transporter [Gemmatimonadales bacterium]